MLIIDLIILFGPMLFPALFAIKWFSFSQYKAQVLANKLFRDRMKKKGLKDLEWAKVWLKMPYFAYPPALFKLVLLIAGFGLLSRWFYLGLGDLDSDWAINAWKTYFGLFLLVILSSSIIAFLSSSVQSNVRFHEELCRTLLVRIAQNANGPETMGLFTFAVRRLHDKAFFRTIGPAIIPYMNKEEMELMAFILKEREVQRHSAYFKKAAKDCATAGSKLPQPEEMEKALRKVDFESMVNGKKLRALFTRKAELAAANASLEKVLAGFGRFYRAPNAIYCQKCQRRPQRIDKEPWHWWVCPSCKEWRHLIPNVKAVHGHLGDYESMDEADGTLHYQLWDKFTNSAVAIELDVLEIHPSVQINLQLASFLEKTDNLPPKEALHFEAILHDGLQLDPNLMRQLEHHVPKLSQASQTQNP